MAKGKLLAEGSNQFFSEGAERGHETWQISQLGHGGIIITSRAEFSGPHLVAPHGGSWNLTYEVDRGWAPVSLTLRLEQDGKVLTSTQRADGDRWVAEIDNAGQITNYELPFSNKHEVDFGTTLFNTVTLLRARLPVGASRDLDVIFIETDTLVPTADKQRYECLAEEKLQVPAGNYSALKYRMTHPDEENSQAYEFWADHAGIVLLYQGPNNEIKQIRYRRVERR